MKVNKSQGLLYIYDVLKSKGSFTKGEIVSQLEITDLTFLRYMQELRAYLSNFYIGQQLSYSRKTETYTLKNK